MTFVSLQLLSLKVKSSKEFSPPSSSSFPFSFFGQKEKWAFFWADDSLRSCYLHLGLYFLLGRGIWNVCWLEKMRRAAKFLSFSLAPLVFRRRGSSRKCFSRKLLCIFQHWRTRQLLLIWNTHRAWNHSKISPSVFQINFRNLRNFSIFWNKVTKKHG